MNIYRQIDEIVKQPNTILTLGTFDGLHLGHQEILNKLFERSRFHNGRSFLITFYPHPRKVITGTNDQKSLSTMEEKAQILQTMGLDNLFIINFTREFSQKFAIEFIKDLVIDKIGLREIVIGHDHKFGKGREGNQETLKNLGKELGFDVTIVEAFKIGDETINSTKIRQALSNGNIKRANMFLGRLYSFGGMVIAGDKRGRVLGYPTANIKLFDDDKLLPSLGIYAAEVIIDSDKFFGLLSIGRRPTFYDNGEIVSEVYIYNFDDDIYGKKVTVYILDKIRGEEKFSSPDELINQMNKDKEAGQKIFESLNNTEKFSIAKN